MVFVVEFQCNAPLRLETFVTKLVVTVLTSRVVLNRRVTIIDKRGNRRAAFTAELLVVGNGTVAAATRVGHAMGAFCSGLMRRHGHPCQPPGTFGGVHNP